MHFYVFKLQKSRYQQSSTKNTDADCPPLVHTITAEDVLRKLYHTTIIIPVLPTT